ncbi:MAG: hypothetical protein ABGY95_05275 [Rubritalea sp.]
MAKATFYFVITMLVVVDVIQVRHQKKRLAKKGKAACLSRIPLS